MAGVSGRGVVACGRLLAVVEVVARGEGRLARRRLGRPRVGGLRRPDRRGVADGGLLRLAAHHRRERQRVGGERRHRLQLGHPRRERHHRGVLHHGGIGVEVSGRQAQGLVVVGCHVALARVEEPLGVARVTVPHVAELDPPQAVVALGGVPVDLVGGHAAPGQPLRDEVAERRPRGRLARHPYGHTLRLLGDVLPLLQHRPLEPADALDGDPGGRRDLLRRLSSSDAGLDLLGAQRALHFDLVLAETGEVAADGSTEPVVHGKREARTPSGSSQHEVGAVLTYRDESELLHASPFVSVAILPPDP